MGAPLSTNDEDGDALTHALLGDDAGSFDIDADTGQLLTKEGVIYNYEFKKTYSVTV